jgi:hypothetical protein
MNAPIPRNMPPAPPNFFKTPLGIATFLALVLGGVVLFWSERPNVLGWLPWLIVLACPLLHVFMHRHPSGDETSETEHSESATPPHRH